MEYPSTFSGNAYEMSMFVDNPFSAENTPTVLTAHMDRSSRLPFLYAEPPPPELLAAHRNLTRTSAQCSSTSCAHTSTINLYDPKNHNLSATQKRLKLDHDRLGHIGFQRLQRLYSCTKTISHFDGSQTAKPPCLVPRDKRQAKCEPPTCSTCLAAKARRRPTGSKSTRPNPAHTDVLRADDLVPGSVFSVDQYESSVRGRLPSTRGRESLSLRYVGGTLFFDHASGKIFVRHQKSLSARETINAKRSVEREALEHGVHVRKYHADNGVFQAAAFEQALIDDHQFISKSGVGAHHQNGVAERAIGTAQAMARAMLLHLRIHWPDEFDPALWPFALDYAVHVYNNLPYDIKNGLSPQEIFSGVINGTNPLRRLRVFGSPCYVLDPRLQDGKKIPKWEPRARQGQFLGFSKEHSSTVALIRNIKTGHISPQFHVVYDEQFHTVTSDLKIDLTQTWIDLFKHSRDVYLDWYDPAFDGAPPALSSEWTDPHDPGPVFTPITESQGLQPIAEDDASSSSSSSTETEPFNETLSDLSEIKQDENSVISSHDKDSSRVLEVETNFGDDPEWVSLQEPPPISSRTRASKRARGVFTLSPRSIYRPIISPTFSHVLQVKDSNNLAYVTLDWESVPEDPTYQHFHALFTRFYDDETCELLDGDAIHPFALASKLHNEDFPSYRDIFSMPYDERQKWFASMDEELQALFEFGTFEFVDRADVEKQGEDIVKTTWAFRKKRKPSGEVYRYKSRLCVRGDLQKGTYDSNDTFAPVVEWPTIRTLFTLGVLDNWASASIDFKNAFVQSTLPQPIYLELPPGYAKANPQHSGSVLKVHKSLYGDRRAANLWYRKLRSSLESDALGFTVSAIDPCLFIRDDCIMVLYVDDAVLFARDESTLSSILSTFKDLDYNFSRDGSFSSYLGIKLETLSNGDVKLSQPGLKRACLDVMGLSDANPSPTPISTPLFKHMESPPFDEAFNYRSALGMLQYIGNNTHPECCYAINSCARYCITPRQAHGTALKRIGRYLKGTLSDGLILKSQGDLALNCHVDADFAGNFRGADADDSRATRSRSGYVITLGQVPVLWKSKMQTEIALSTMEAEYIALSTAMRSLVHLRALLFEIDSIFSLGISSRLSTISTVFEDNRACQILATTDPPRLTPRSKSLAIKYHWFRAHLSPDSIVLNAVSSEDQLGDGFTKPLTIPKFREFRARLCGW